MRKQLGVRALVVAAVAVVTLAFAGSASAATYVVLYKAKNVPADAARKIKAAGGKLVVAYDEVGVAVAKSTSATFRPRLLRDTRVEQVSRSTPVAKAGPMGTLSHDEQEPELPNAPATPDSLAALQWDMRQIHAFEANAITGGSPAVVTGIIDTGVDKDHPDLVQNIDFSRSASCESGIPDQDPAAWDDRHGHGTHTGGTVAAADNEFGITGVAPNTKLAAIKSSLDTGYFFVEMVVCSFLWAGGAAIDDPATPGLDFPATAGPRVDVTNNSYYMDPFLYNCRNDPLQRALWKAAKRAILYAYKQGVTNVASLGNDADDRAHPTYDASSPDYPPGQEVERTITNACVVIPVEVPGVIGVSSVGNTRQIDGNDDPDDYLKAYYSAYGVGVTDVTAPGGDFYWGRGTEAQPFGLVLSTWPTEQPCSRSVKEDPGAPPFGATQYCYLQGTSMAAPHAAGVAALIISRYGDADNPQNGKMRPGAVEQYMQHTADPQPCPTDLESMLAAPGTSIEGAPYTLVTRPDGSPQECQGGEGYNSWYGSGQVNALKAVLHDTSNTP
ncbi:MAG: S8 family serine peptidase [Actinobacteria bacterium]|nr:S8 family serine peptidase [Actinomycetota bacterium]